ncbi:tyrosine-protein phosphatase [Silvibacterium acidisoli]|uniref:tyrosine-protein phosphatase n=1 Tax=Acidobacteriaceae bacterium ZG23-2 TaxID=2883246 RepID=UPI00406C9DB3
MIDIHHHLLFGLDDGSTSLELSLEMAEAAAADGITHVVCTPHANSRYPFQPEVNRERMQQIQEGVGSKLTLGLGCDFHLSYDNIEDALKNRSKYSINGKQYLLVEFDDLMIPNTMTDAFYELMVAGMIPIITHPERNLTIQKHPERMKPWLREGCLVQVTAASLTGRFGKTAQAMAMQFLERDWVNFLATDAHNVASRPPKMSEGYQVVAKRFGAETAERLCVSNPKAVFFGEDLPPQPAPQKIEDEREENQNRRKGGFFSRLFSN